MTDRKVEKLLLSETEDIVSSDRERILSECGVKAKTGVSWKPVLSGALAAVFIIAFAVICYIPVYYKNHGITPTDTSEADVSETFDDTFETMPEAVEGVPFETVKSGSAEGLVVLCTNGEEHHPYVNLSYRCTRGADGKNDREHYETVPRTNNDEYYTYGADLSLKNNVIDREMTVINVCVLQSGDDVVNGVGSIEKLKEYLNNAPDGYYMVGFYVTWDSIDLSGEGEYFDVYTVGVVMSVEGHDLFKNVVVFNLETAEQSDELKLDLPLDKHCGNVREYTFDGIERIGFGVYTYEDENQTEQVCLLDEKYGLVFDSAAKENESVSPKFIYAEGPSGPVLFYSVVEKITYEGQSCGIYKGYVYDLTERRADMISEVGPFAYSSGRWDMLAGFGYFTGPHKILLGMSGKDHSQPGRVVINFYKQVEVVYNNGKYELADQPYPDGYVIPKDKG